MSLAMLRQRKPIQVDPSVLIIPIGELNAPDYQRDENQAQIEKMVRDWDPYQLQELTVSEHADGTYWVIDGLHRLAAAKKRGLENLRCFVVRALTEEQEAGLFRKLNKNRRPVNAWDDFRAALKEKEPTAIRIKAIADEFGFRISRAGGYGNIKAVVGLRKIHQMGGDSLLRETLKLITEVWEGDKDATETVCLLGVAAFLSQYRSHPAFSRDRFVEVLSKVPVARLIREVSAMQVEGAGMVTSNTATTRSMLALRAIYNRGLRTRALPAPVDGRNRVLRGGAA